MMIICTIFDSYWVHVSVGFVLIYYIVYMLIFEKYLLSSDEKMRLSKFNIFMRKYVGSLIGAIILGIIFFFLFGMGAASFCEGNS